MALTQGSQALQSDINDWYSKLNDIISVGYDIVGSNTAGTGWQSDSAAVTSATVPSQPKAIAAQDIYTIADKINALLNDPYIQSQPTMYSSYNSGLYSSTSTLTYAVKNGQIIYGCSITPINTTLSNMSSIVCRNQASYTYGTKTSGSYESGTKSNYQKSNGSKSSSTKVNSMYGNGTKGNSTQSSGTYGSSLKSNSSKSSGTKSNTTRGYGYKQNAKYSSGYDSSGTYGSGTQSSGYYGSGEYSNGDKTNGNNTNTTTYNIFSSSTSLSK